MNKDVIRLVDAALDQPSPTPELSKALNDWLKVNNSPWRILKQEDGDE